MASVVVDEALGCFGVEVAIHLERCRILLLLGMVCLVGFQALELGFIGG